MLTSRQAESRLYDEFGVTRRRARRLLGCGLAGEPVRTTASLLYDEERLEALIGRPPVSVAVLRRHSEAGLFIARRDVDVRLPLAEQRDRLAGGWRLSLPTLLWLRSRIARHASVPLVATVGGFVVAGAEIVGAVGDRDPGDYPGQPVVGRPMPRTRLDLRAAGDWFADFAARRLMTPPGQPAFVLGGLTAGGADLAKELRSLP